ncbi:biliverdin-producing heme oxygenase [Spirosoma soli]|uniref:Biliverdin-producing heme oxygenase n=1 Tax=Spirosoma soli TaxID=1770529 RepID=A0ABW5M2Q3_9BACT
MNTIAERLREETRPIHEQTEHLLYADALRTGTLSADQYRHLLLTHFGYHRSLESAIDQHPDFFADYEPDTRRKTPWLAADLAQLHLSQPFTDDVFTAWSPTELLGAAYVGEGSMLGGKTVWHYLQQCSAVVPLLKNARFYQGYGSETGQRWRAFGAFLTQKAAGRPDVVVDAAQRAFLIYHKLFKAVQLILTETNPV